MKTGLFSSDKPQKIGLPSVAYFAEELHLSANYFGDLIKKETEKSAKDYILELNIGCWMADTGFLILDEVLFTKT